ncbi:MAG TPA: hypothetical protein VHK69_15225, partial [Chitinophagaceae bacterium]|nr:hypothetical protein [Chitinophagaceae bacterium]
VFAALVLMSTAQATLNKGLAFFIVCCAAYYLGGYMIVNACAASGPIPLFIFLMSLLGAILISLTYSVLFRNSISLKRDVTRPAVVAIKASSLSILACIFMQSASGWVGDIGGVFLLTVFPFWSISMRKHLMGSEKGLTGTFQNGGEGPSLSGN